MRIYRDDKPGAAGESWFIDYRYGRVRYRYKAGASKDEAETHALKVEYQMKKRTLKPEELIAEVRGVGGDGLSFGKLVESFLSGYRSKDNRIKFYDGRAKVWLRYFKPDTLVSEIGPAQIRKYRNDRRKELQDSYLRNHPGAEPEEKRDAGSSTVRKELIALGTMFEWAMGEGSVSDNPAHRLKVKRPAPPPARDLYLYPEQREAATKQAEPEVRALMEWLYQTGMRVGEMCRLCRGEIDSQFAYVTSRKGGKAVTRKVPLTEGALALLKAERRRQKVVSAYAFPGPTGERLDPNWVSKRIKGAMRAAGLPEKASAHSLRHARISDMGEAGKRLKNVAAMMGQHPTTLERHYLHTRDEQLLALVK